MVQFGKFSLLNETMALGVSPQTGSVTGPDLLSPQSGEALSHDRDE
jgi:hypothetical protein